MGRGGSATIRSVTLVGDGTDDSASGGEAIVVLNAAENRQRDQFAAGRRLLEELGIGVGYGMCRLRRACPVVEFDELPDDPPNVGCVEEDEVVERIFTQRAMESLDARIRVRSVVRRGQSLDVHRHR
jgi:hypothetical protein